MSLRTWASGFLVLTLLSTAGCGKSNNVPTSQASPGTDAVLKLVDLSGYKDDVEACFASTEEQFREECKDLEERPPYSEGADLPIRTGAILLAEAPEDWRAADPEPPAWNLSLLDPKSESEPQTIGFVFHTRSNQGQYQTQGEGDNESGSVKVFTKDALVFLVDRRSHTLLGSVLLRGPVPEEVKAGKTKITGGKPDLQILEKCDVVKLEETASKLDGFVRALSAGEKDALASLASNSDVESDLINRQWNRFELLTGPKAKLESNYEGLVTSEAGLLTLYSVVNSSTDTSPDLMFSFREETLTKVDLDLTKTEEKQLAVALAKGTNLQYESAESLAEIASLILDSKETALADRLLTLAEAKAETKQEKTVVSNLAKAILRKKQERHSGRVELLNNEALGFLATKDFKSALAKLKKAQELNPNDDESLFLLLRTYDGLKDFNKARVYAQKLDQEHPNSKYARRVEEFKGRLKDRENRLKMGGDPSARYQLTSKTTRRLGSYAQLVPTAQTELDADLAEFIRQGYNRSGQFERISLQKDTKAQILKTAYFQPEPNRRTTRGGRYYSRSYGRQPELDAAYVTILSGRNKGRKGWVKLDLVDYSDIGIASEPFALPLIDPKDAYKK